MATPEDFKTFPKPHREFHGRVRGVSDKESLRDIAQPWRPRDAKIDEVPAATVARFSQGLVRADGTPVTADDIGNGLCITDPEAFRGNIGAGSYINVKTDFDAVGDGVADDTAAIVAASNSLRLTGGILYFPRGTYMVRAALDVDGLPWATETYGSPQIGPRPCFQIFSNMIVQGDGPGVSIIKYADTTTDGPMIHANTATNLGLRDITLDGNSSRLNRPWGGGESEGFDTKQDCRNIRIENVHFRNFPNEAIDFDNGDTAAFPSTNYGWDLDGYQLLIRDCIFENIGGEAIHNPNWGVIDNCQFRNCSHDRWLTVNDGNPVGSIGQGAIDGSGENMIVRGCSFIDCVRAVDVYRKVGDNANTYLGKATGTYTFTGQPTVGQPVTVGGQVYTWSSAGKSITGVAATDIFTVTSHGWADATPVRFVYQDGGGGFARHITYYVRDATTHTFKLAATAGGAAIDLTTTMAGGRITDDWPLDNEVELGATANLSATYLAFAVNGNFEECAVNASAWARYSAPSIASGTPAIVTLVAKPKGALGNAVTFSSGSTNVTASGATLSGGGTRNESNIRIIDCIVEDWLPPAGGAVLISGTDNVVVSGCTFRGVGIAIGSSGIGTKVVNCDVLIHNNTHTATAVSLLGVNSHISNTRIRGGVVYTNADGLSVVGCDILSAYGAIQVEGAGCDNVRVTGCILATSGNTALGAAGTLPPVNFQSVGQTNHSVTGCRITGGNHGIMMQANSTASGNVITGVAFNGITLTGTGNVVTGNYATAGTIGIANTGITNTIVGNYGTGIPVENTGFQRAGNATLVAGAVTVANTSVTANTIVMVTRKTAGGTIGDSFTYTVTAGTEFSITSNNAADTSVVSYQLIN